VKFLRSGRSTKSGLQAVAGGRVANPRTGVYVVVAKDSAYQLLYQERFFVGATRRADATNGATAILGLDALEPAAHIVDGFVPRDFFPGVINAPAYHRFQNPVGVRRISKRKPAFDTGVAVVGVAVLVWHHANHLVTLDLGLERATDAAVGTSCLHNPV